MATPFLGQIQAFAFGFAPRNWAMCNGQLLSIAQNTALFSLLGTTYGGNGVTTFALPDLRSRTSNHQGQGPGLTNYVLGQISGVETVTLTIQNLPAHIHPMAVHASSAGKLNTNPGTNKLGAAQIYTSSPVGPAMDPAIANPVSNAGSSQPHPNIQPYLAINWCIALTGIFPSRN
jgi:microcystin-dependent protein